MNIQELESKIKASLDDFKLDMDEKQMFKELSTSLEDEQLRFIRNKAFDLSRPHIEKGSSEAIRVLNWLERLLKAVQPIEPVGAIKSSAYFSPGNDCRNKIISLINNAKKNIKICVFTISDNTIVKAIIGAHQRGIDITIISDNDKANDKGSDIDYLSDKGIEVILDRSAHHMHHKFALFDDTILLNGSFNWTRSATTVNQENILVTSERQLVSDYKNRFYILKNEFI